MEIGEENRMVRNPTGNPTFDLRGEPIYPMALEAVSSIKWKRTPENLCKADNPFCNSRKPQTGHRR